MLRNQPVLTRGPLEPTLWRFLPALDYTSTFLAIAACTVGLLLSLAVAMVLGLMFGPMLSGIS